eukprot:7317412-Pyramimonas_sp.AAC.1
MLGDESLEGAPFHLISELMDLEKSYEYIPLYLFRVLGLIQNVPMGALALSLESYASPRMVRKGQAFAGAMTTCVGPPAGSK